MKREDLKVVVEIEKIPKAKKELYAAYSKKYKNLKEKAGYGIQ